MSGKHHDGWFYAKRFGFGSGPPSSWQGWVAMALYFAGIGLAALLLLPERETVFVAITVSLTLIFMWVAWAKTPGGWQWRWGKDKDTW
ncbi:hypothetical protein WJT74_11310 [Sphingomicrobium sp. XHP0239]|uniref:hypothetical protein n=1 Tax=Sphingomicrobium maritimum TaxID=3133972 RepID=UPI0031CC3A6C